MSPNELAAMILVGSFSFLIGCFLGSDVQEKELKKNHKAEIESVVSKLSKEFKDLNTKNMDECEKEIAVLRPEKQLMERQHKELVECMYDSALSEAESQMEECACERRGAYKECTDAVSYWSDKAILCENVLNPLVKLIREPL